MAKISGPLLDRIDIHIEVPSVPFQELSAEQSGTSSEQMREQVLHARLQQQQRFHGTRTRYNAQMSSRQIRRYCRPDAPSVELLKASVNELGLSARAHDKILRLARTITDLDESPEIRAEHVQEAINYRMLDRQIWT